MTDRQTVYSDLYIQYIVSTCMLNVITTKA